MTHPIIEALRGNEARFTELRRYFHQHPEIGFEEHNTSDRVAALLQEWGYEGSSRAGETGVVGTLKVGNGHKRRACAPIWMRCQCRKTTARRGVVPLRVNFTAAVMTATPQRSCMQRSTARTRNFNGTLHLIFQPAEELLYGGRVMVEDGLFDLFPCDHIFGLHNMPSQPLGKLVCAMAP